MQNDVILLSYDREYPYILIISNNKIRGILASLSAIKYLDLLSQATISVFITFIITETVYQIIFLIQSLSIDLYWNFRTCNLEQSRLSQSLLGFQYYLPNSIFYSLSNIATVYIYRILYSLKWSMSSNYVLNFRIHPWNEK